MIIKQLLAKFRYARNETWLEKQRLRNKKIVHNLGLCHKAKLGYTCHARDKYGECG